MEWIHKELEDDIRGEKEGKAKVIGSVVLLHRESITCTAIYGS